MPAPPVLLALLLCSAGPETGAPVVGEPNPPAVDPAVAAILARWEAATADRVPVSEAEKAALRLASDQSEEALELAAALRGPVSAGDLLERYEWELHRTPLGQRSLSAVPRDPIARAFTPRLFVRLEAGLTPGLVINPADLSRGRANGQDAVRDGLTVVERRIVPGRLVVLAQKSEPKRDSAERSPIRTAVYVKPAGDEPVWKIERRLKKTPATRL
ncbi:hypothetical protein, partial [Alienimonas sp. DA493]|uniref:hypothetical protein n=1 Tax=Alienimonas sp. DA493 TaxID=3373605 RepID=UPI0037547D4C